jgi:hypothetical protein
MACAPLSAEGFALVPECHDGEPIGSLVSVLPAAACEGYWARDPRPILASFVEHAGTPYAIVRAPQPEASESTWPAADYLVVFSPRAGSFVLGLALHVADNAIVGIEAGCNPPERLVVSAEGPLPVIWRPFAA